MTDKDAAATLPELLDRVSGGDTVVVERDGKEMGRIVAPCPRLTDGLPPKVPVGGSATAAADERPNAALRRWFSPDRKRFAAIDDEYEKDMAEGQRFYNTPRVPESPWDR